MEFTFTPHQLKENASGTYNAELRKASYESFPISKFGAYEYIMLSFPTPRPGVNRADVINLTQFNESPFQVAVGGQGNAWVVIYDEGMSILVVIDGEFYEFTNPLTAVLTYRIEVPTAADYAETTEIMDDDLEDSSL